MRKLGRKWLAGILAASLFLSQNAASYRALAEEAQEQMAAGEAALASSQEEEAAAAATEELVIEEPVQEEPAAQEPVIEEPVQEEPAEQEPPAQEPAEEPSLFDPGQGEDPFATEDPGVIDAPADDGSGQETQPSETTVEPPTEPPTERQTEKPTEAPTEKPTEAPTEKPTEKQSEKATEKTTEKPTDKQTEKQTEKETEKQTEKETEKQTEKETEKETEKQTEKESESEDLTDTFTAVLDGLTVTLQTTKADSLPEKKTEFTVRRIGAGDPSMMNMEMQLREKTNEGHRELADFAAYELKLTVDGKETWPAGVTGVTFTYDWPLSLGLREDLEGAAQVYVIDGTASHMDAAQLDETKMVTGFRVSGRNLQTLAVAGVQNHVNDGEEVTQAELPRRMHSLLSYGLAANSLKIEETGDEPEELPEYMMAGSRIREDSGDPEAERKKLEDDLKQLGEFALELANAKSSQDVAVVNLYADDFGVFSEEPLKAVLAPEEEQNAFASVIDVTNQMVVVNLVAARADQELGLPQFALYSKKIEEAKKREIENGKTEAQAEEDLKEERLADTTAMVIYNLVAMDGRKFAAYKGKASLKEEAEGTVFCAEGKVSLEKSITGALYGDTVTLKTAASLNPVLLGMNAQSVEGMEQLKEDWISAKDAETKPAEEEPKEAPTEEEESEESLTEEEPEEALTEAEPATEPEEPKEITQPSRIKSVKTPALRDSEPAEADWLTIHTLDEKDAQLAGNKVVLTDAEGTPLTIAGTDEEGNETSEELSKVSEADKPVTFTSLDFLASSAGKAFGEDGKQTIYAVETPAPGYYIEDESKRAELVLALDEDGNVRVESVGGTPVETAAEVTFRNKPPQTVIALTVNTLAQDTGKQQAGNTVALTDEAGTVLTVTSDSGSGSETTDQSFTTTEAALEISLDTAASSLKDALEELEAGGTLTLLVTETPVSGYYISAASSKVEVVLEKDAYGNISVKTVGGEEPKEDPAAVTFTNLPQKTTVTLMVNTLAEDTKKQQAGNTLVLIDPADEKTITVTSTAKELTQTSGADKAAEFTFDTADSSLKAKLDALAAGGELTIDIRESKTADGYYIEDDKAKIPVALTKDADGNISVKSVNGAAPAAEKDPEASFTNKPRKTTLSLTVNTIADDTKKQHSGNTVSLTDADNKVLTVKETDSAGKESDAEQTWESKADAPLKISLDTMASSLKEKLDALKADGTLSIYVAEKPADGYYIDDKAAKVEIVLTKDKYGNVTIKTVGGKAPAKDPAEVTFTNEKLTTEIYLDVRAVAASGSTRLAGATFVLRGPDGTVLKDADNKDLAWTSKTSVQLKTLSQADYDWMKELPADGVTTVTLTVSQVNAPDGYVLRSEADQKVVIAKDKKGNLVVTSGSESEVTSEKAPHIVTFVNRKKSSTEAADTIAVTKQVYREDGRMTAGSSGLTYYVALFSDEDRTVRVTDVQTITVESGKSSAALTIGQLEPGTYYVGETDAYGKLTGTGTASQGYYAEYVSSEKIPYKVEISRAIQGKSTVTHPVTIRNHYYSITVNKRLYYNDIALNPPQGTQYKISLFSDSERKTKVAGPATATFSANSNVATVRFTGIKPGNYYVGETDDEGNLIADDSTKSPYAVYEIDGTEGYAVTVTAGKTTQSNTVLVKNDFTEVPEGFTLTASFKIVKKVEDADKNAVASNATFYVAAFEGDTWLGAVSLPMNGRTEAERSLALPVTAGNDRIITLKEVAGTASDSKVMEDGTSFTMRSANGETTTTYKVSSLGASMTLRAGQTTDPTATFTNTIQTQKQQEEENIDLTKDPKLIIDKRVVYKGTEMSVNDEFFLGVYTDPGLDKENRQKAYRLTFKDQARTLSASAANGTKAETIELPLNLSAAPLNSEGVREITLYIAELDSRGNPLTSSFEYNVSYAAQDDKTKVTSSPSGMIAVTLNPKNYTASVMITNTIPAGSSLERKLTDPSSGYAGNSATLAQAQQLQREGNAGSATGDETPIWPLAAALGGSAAVILLLAVLLIRRRKRQ